MIKIVSFLRRNPALDPAGFRAYWRDVHAPLVRARLPGLVRYTGSFPIEGEEGQGERGQGEKGEGEKGTRHVARGDFDGIVELAFVDRATMERQMASATFNDAQRQASSEYLMDMPACRSMVVEELDAL